MNQGVQFFMQYWRELTIPAAILLASFVIGLVARKVLFYSLRKYAARTTTKIDDLLLNSVRSAFLLWMLLLGVYVATQVSPVSDRVARLTGQITLALWILSLTSVASRVVAGAIQQWGSGLSQAVPVTTLTQSVARYTVVALGALLLLNQFGVSITPLLTALGVGGLAVALALQDTLANLFAGFYVSISGQVRVGDYIKLESGEEGFVFDINWRSTSIRALPNNLIIVPNGKLSQSIITNYSLPEKRMALLIPVSVSYGCDPELVERVLVEEAKKGTTEISGLLAQPEPFVRFIPGFGQSSLDFTLICQVGEFVDQYLAQHELRKRIFSRFRKEGIEIPFPVQTIYLRKDG
jgi:small-conductance mechanosensitive channel